MGAEEPEENITHMDAWLYKAAAEGNIEVFNNNQRLQLNFVSHDSGFNIFITVIRRDKISDFIRQILSKCPSLLLQTNAKGQTPFHVAARYGNSTIVKLLIKSCAKARDGDLEKLGMDQVNAVGEMLRITDQESNTALHEAARRDNVEVVKALLVFKDPDFPYSTNKKQETALYNVEVDEALGQFVVGYVDSDFAGDLDKRRSTTGQSYLGTVLKILSLCPDCCEKVDNKGLNLLHYLVFRGAFSPLRVSLFELGVIETVYGSFRNLRELEGAFEMTPQEVYYALRSKKQHQKQKQINDLLEEIETDQVAEDPVRLNLLPTISAESLEKTRDAHLVVAALIATIAFTAVITVPGGLNSEKRAAFKAFVVTNALAFILSISAIFIHSGVLGNMLSGFKFGHRIVLYRTLSVSGILFYATFAMLIAFSTGSYVVLKPSHGLAIVSYLIYPVFFVFMLLILNLTSYM
ncbi:hypothetical protein ES332_D04G226600v1 [Gossypium tomentosum]|uniref:PGG domain-containing protein n=1 Tax=Gossypium tomentosum TaxID=34277 RepID=A0A5D2LHF7_GOSTO|nr:hypothetical protein ES332_D04G226600v1 [Gossypium tomentosum]